MKRMALFLVAALLSYPLVADAEDVQFTIINDTDSPLVGFYVTHSKTDQWGANLVPDGQFLAVGSQIGVIIDDGRTTCLYDIRADFQDGGNLEDYEINVCELDSYTFQ